MFAEERYQHIIDLVQRKGKVMVAELSELLQVSPVTIRRDLEKLEESNWLIRTHGGAISLESAVVGTSVEKPFSEKKEALAAEKERIATEAVAWIQDQESILLTPGTTNMMIAQKLTSKKQLTVVTNAVNIASYLCSYTEHDVILLGGKLRKKSMAAVGALTEMNLQQIRVDKLFLGVDGIDQHGSFTTPNMEEATVNHRMIRIAREVIVVADHSKFGKVTFAHMASIMDIDALISDDKLDPAQVELFNKAGIEVKLV